MCIHMCSVVLPVHIAYSNVYDIIEVTRSTLHVFCLYYCFWGFILCLVTSLSIIYGNILVVNNKWCQVALTALVVRYNDNNAWESIQHFLSKMIDRVWLSNLDRVLSIKWKARGSGSQSQILLKCASVMLH